MPQDFNDNDKQNIFPDKSLPEPVLTSLWHHMVSPRIGEPLDQKAN